jgi:hypothetical protein
MCTVHDGEPELGRLPLLRKSLPAPTAHTLIETKADVLTVSRALELALFHGWPKLDVSKVPAE